MKIVKRDGRIVEYDSEKIRIAIGKANAEVVKENTVTPKEIESIITYIEGLKRKRMLVEDIQDIIEEKLMEFKKYDLAKRYIIYRYTRTLVRKSNTTDETILSIIKQNSKSNAGDFNKNAQSAAGQRNLIAGEVSKDLTKRILLPEKISKAHELGEIYFHGAEYFLQPIIENSIINIQDMLDNGTVMNGKVIDSPNGFQVACTVMTQIIAMVASGQYGSQTIEINHLGKYLRKSYEKYKRGLEEKYTNSISKDKVEEIVQDRVKEELIAGVQTIQYQINTFITTNGRPPLVTLFLNVSKDDEYANENARIVEEILRQRYEGMKNEKGEYISPDFPKLVYVLNEENSLNGQEYDYLTRIAIKCSKKTGSPDYISDKKMAETNNGNVFAPAGNNTFLPLWKEDKGRYKFECRFNQGTISINLVQLGIIADGNKEEILRILDKRLDLCFEALMCRHCSLLGTLSNISPIHWQNGAIARLESGDKIDKYLKDGYSSVTLQYVGLVELERIVEQKNGEVYARDVVRQVVQKLNATCENWRKATGIGFLLSSSYMMEEARYFARIDKERFGVIKKITDKEEYSNYAKEVAWNVIDDMQLEEKVKEIYNDVKYYEVTTE